MAEPPPPRVPDAWSAPAPHLWVVYWAGARPDPAVLAEEWRRLWGLVRHGS